MSAKDYQENLRRIVGLEEDAGAELEAQEPKADIGAVRGFAAASGCTPTASDGTPEPDDEGTVIGVDDPIGGTDTDTRTGTDLGGGGGSDPPVTGETMPRITGIYDCGTGEEITLNFGNVDFPAQVTVCDGTEYPWDTPDCYHIEKRGDLKEGWDSVDYYREPINCAQHFSYQEDKYYAITANYTGGFVPRQAAIAPQLYQQVLEDIDGYAPTFSRAILKQHTGPIEFLLFYGTLPESIYAQVLAGSATIGSGAFGIGQSVPVSLIDCAESTADYCNPTPEDLEVCDQYPELCAPPTEDPVEDCNPLELLQEEQCCPPDCADITQPATGDACKWDTDGVVDYVYNKATARWEANLNDPDIFDLQLPTVLHPAEMNVCDASGNPLVMKTSVDGDLLIKHASNNTGGILYLVDGDTGKIRQVASGDIMNNLADPNDTLNW